MTYTFISSNVFPTTTLQSSSFSPCSFCPHRPSISCYRTMRKQRRRRRTTTTTPHALHMPLVEETSKLLIPGTVCSSLETTHLLTLSSSLSNGALEAAKVIAGPGINIFNFVMIVRIILTWYPQTNLAKAPWIFIAVPTEPLLRATRKVIKPVGGVDISPIVWFALMSFVHEILVGPQGILVLLSQK